MTMFRKNTASSQKEFPITEKPLPLAGWDSTKTGDFRAGIEQDVRTLMRQLAEARFALAEQEKEQMDKTKRLLLAVIEVMDGFERVFRDMQVKQDQIVPQCKTWANRFRTVYLQLDEVIVGHGVIRIENLERGFDPHWHRILETVADPSRPNGEIIEEVKRGYVWKTQILRKTEVVVVRNEELPSGQTLPSVGETG